MLRIVLIIIPFFAPWLIYTAWRWLRYGRANQNPSAVPKPISAIVLFFIGAVLVALNVIFLVGFDSIPADKTGYHYPIYGHEQN